MSVQLRFEEALNEQNYSTRCHALAELGRYVKGLGLEKQALEAALDGLSGADLPAAFVDKARLVVARGAGCMGYARKFLDHPSQTVRFSAVRSGLLYPSEAREAFLSQDCGMKLKKLLATCHELPFDEEVLERAERIFGAHDEELVWQVLCKTEDEAVLRRWLDKERDWEAPKFEKILLPHVAKHFPRLAQRFPGPMLDLVEKERVALSWHWVMPLLQSCPDEVLRLSFLNYSSKAKGPLHNQRNYFDSLASWGWRHRSETMLEICGVLSTRGSVRSGNCQSWLGLAKAMMTVKSTKHYLTTSHKLRLLVEAFKVAPDSQRTPQNALAFVDMLPTGLPEHRQAEIEHVISAFWQLVDLVRRESRRPMLVGPEDRPALTDTLSVFLKKLPPPLAVQQFYRILGEAEAGKETYRFVQSKICATGNGHFDNLMGEVFERFLQKEEEGAKQVAEMFQTLLQDARSMDVVQRSFDQLTERLGGHTEPHLLQKVVQRMGQLEQQVGRGDAPQRTLATPTAWASFVEPAPNSPPHVELLYRLLHAGTGPHEPLGALLTEYGPSFFWDALDCVLQSSTHTGPKKQQAAKSPDLGCLSTLDLRGLARPLVPGRAKTTGGAGPPSIYFTKLAELKSKTYGHNDDGRQAGYNDMMKAAREDVDPSAAFEDLLPFFVSRLGREKDCLRSQVVETLLTSQLPPSLWAEKLKHLRALHRTTPKCQRWRSVGHTLVASELRRWAEGEEASEACRFGLEAGQLCAGKSSELPSIFVEVSASGPPVCSSAAQWVVETSAPLASPPHARFWECLNEMAVVAKNTGGARDLWARWPFLGEHWRALLKEGVPQKSAEFLFVEVVNMLRRGQETFRKGEYGNQEWWEPLQCEEYKQALLTVRGQMESGEIPARDAASILVRRITELLACVPQKRTNPRHASKWLRNQDWDIQKHKVYSRLHCRPRRDGEALVELELRTLTAVLQRDAHRQVLWQITEAAALVSGPLMQELLKQAITVLDPRQEGMARCIARSYPYLNMSLTKGEDQQGCPDVLTPLLELWLAEDSTRDAAVGELMQRGDFQYFLFFGTSFATHLSKVRQEWLHRCLSKLRACPEDGVNAEFYHYSRCGLGLLQLAKLGVKHQRTAPQDSCARHRRSHKDAKLGNSAAIQLYLWHPHTQGEFLTKGLTSTTPLALEVTTRLEFADGIARANQLLASYPRELTKPDPEWGWEVLQTAGAYSSLETELERHFAKLPAPSEHDAVADTEVNQLLFGLGRADNAAAALAVLGRYAAKVKQAKEAVVKMVMMLSPTHARKVMLEVMLTPGAGVALQVVALKLITDLNIPSPLALYRTAWCDGTCHRDVAANLLAKLGTSPAVDWTPEQVRDLFGFFELEERKEDHHYVADFLLDRLIFCREWALPFLPEIVERLLSLPGVVGKATQALVGTTTHVTEVLTVLTRLHGRVRLALRAKGTSAKQSSPEARALMDLAAVGQDFTTGTNSVSQKPLEQCEPGVLRAFALTQLKSCLEQQKPAMRPALGIWFRALRLENTDSWAATLQDILAQLRQTGDCEHLCTLVRSAVARAKQLDLPPDSRAAAVNAVRRLLEELLDNDLLRAEEMDLEQDMPFRQKEAAKADAAQDILLNEWPQLLCRGCPPSEHEALFARCPPGRRLDMAKAVVESAVAVSEQPWGPWNVGSLGDRAGPGLALLSQGRERHLSTLLGLWAQVAARAPDLSTGLQLLQPPLPAHLCAQAFDALQPKIKRPADDLLREGLTWLASQAPAEAVARWPKVLGLLESIEVEDVARLLRACEASQVAPPSLPPAVARMIPEEGLRQLVQAGLPEIRLEGLQVLRERSWGEAEVGMAERLCEDECEIVRAAARQLQAAVAR